MPNDNEHPRYTDPEHPYSGSGGSGEHPNFKSEQRARALSANSNTAFA